MPDGTTRSVGVGARTSKFQFPGVATASVKDPLVKKHILTA